MPHVYLTSAETPKGPILVDATWQQFLAHSKRDPALPKVAVGTADEIVELAREAGVIAKRLDYWKKPAPPSVTSQFDGRFSYGFHD